MFQFAITSFTSNARYGIYLIINVGELLITQVLTYIDIYSRSIAHFINIWYREFDFQCIFVHLLFTRAQNTVYYCYYYYYYYYCFHCLQILSASMYAIIQLQWHKSNCQCLFRSSLYPTA